MKLKKRFIREFIKHWFRVKEQTSILFLMVHAAVFFNDMSLFCLFDWSFTLHKHSLMFLAMLAACLERG